MPQSPTIDLSRLARVRAQLMAVEAVRTEVSQRRSKLIMESNNLHHELVALEPFYMPTSEQRERRDWIKNRRAELARKIASVEAEEANLDEQCIGLSTLWNNCQRYSQEGTR